MLIHVIMIIGIMMLGKKIFKKIKNWWNCTGDRHEWGEEQPHPKPMPLLSIYFRYQCKYCGEIRYWRRGATLVFGDSHYKPIKGDGWEQFDDKI